MTEYLTILKIITASMTLVTTYPSHDACSARVDEAMALFREPPKLIGCYETHIVTVSPRPKARGE